MRLRIVAATVAACAILASGWGLPAPTAAGWDRVPPGELSMAAPAIEPDADAEALVWDVRVTDQARETAGRVDIETVFEHYLRIKVFTERGRDTASRVDLVHPGNTRILDVAGRSTRPDGRVVELDGHHVFEKDLVRTSGSTLKATSFVLPGVERGSVIEYRWLERRPGSLATALRLPFSRSIPVHIVRYHIRPVSWPGVSLALRVHPFQCTLAPLVREASGTFGMSLTHIPAHRTEPAAPSEWAVRPWVMVYYDRRTTAIAPRTFWESWTKAAFRTQEKPLTPTARTRQLAARLVTPGTPVNEAIATILDYCRLRIRRADLSTAVVGERPVPAESPQDALQTGWGTGPDVARTFAAIARLAGYDARLVAVPSREDARFDPADMLPQLFHDEAVAVGDGTRWHIVDPTHVHAPHGEPRWQMEGQPVIVPDQAGIVETRVPTASPLWSASRRVVRATVSADGTLEGDITATLTGHCGISARLRDSGLTPDGRLSSLIRSFSEPFPGITLSDVSIRGVDEPAAPYVYQMHFRLPGFGRKAGSRLVVTPFFLDVGLLPVLTAPTRTHPLFFEYAFQATDDIELVLPPHHQIELPAQRPGIALGPFATLTTSMSASPGGRTLRATRELVFGKTGRLEFPATFYPALKQFVTEAGDLAHDVVVFRRSSESGGQP